jgi:hypothetical protein
MQTQPTTEIDEEEIFKNYRPPTVHGQLAPPPPAPDWAQGCAGCQYGLVEPPALTGAWPIFTERCIQFERHELKFCECKAGRMQLQHLRTKAPAERQKEQAFLDAFNKAKNGAGGV